MLTNGTLVPINLLIYNTPVVWIHDETKILSQEMSEVLCLMSLSSGTITAHFHLNMRMNNVEVNLSEQLSKNIIHHFF